MSVVNIADGALDVVAAGTSGAAVLLGDGSTYTSVLQRTFSLTTQALARSALDYFKSNLDFISQARGVLGAQQSRIAADLNVVTTRRENYLAANSRIIDADVAAESCPHRNSATSGRFRAGSGESTTGIGVAVASRIGRCEGLVILVDFLLLRHFPMQSR